MCGIFGYIGKKDPLKTCLEGLKLLEYRGYDSAGIAGLHQGKLFFCKEVGKICHLEKKLSSQKVPLELAIAQTRWATHGEPCQKNAHPHLDNEHTVALIHNGIIENHHQLRQKLIDQGYHFVSETDTEVIAQLIAFHYQNDFLESVVKTLKELKGSFALAIIHKNHPGHIIAATRESPLAIGFNEQKTEIVIASDSNAFLGKDLQVTYLQNDEIAVLQPHSVEICNFKKEKIEKECFRFILQNYNPTKEGFPHFMLKEIYEQPKAIQNTLLAQQLENFGLHALVPKLSTVDQIVLVACGSSWHAGLFAASLIEEKLQIPCRTEIASELRFKNIVFSKNTLVIAISQSGETADTLSAIRMAKEKKASILGICNVPNSTLTRESDGCLFLQAGPEFSVCSTKAFSSQITTLFLFCLFLGRVQNILSKDEESRLLEELKKMPEIISKVLEKREEIQKLAKKYSHFDNFFFLGRSHMYITSLEAALKLKEISYVNANSYPAGELKHGPIALLSPTFPAIAFCSHERSYEKTLSNLQEIKARKAPLLAFASESMKEVSLVADDTLSLPSTIDELAIFPSVVAGQLFAYYVAIEKGTEIDHPRNLAKSVTVE